MAFPHIAHALKQAHLPVTAETGTACPRHGIQSDQAGIYGSGIYPFGAQTLRIRDTILGDASASQSVNSSRIDLRTKIGSASCRDRVCPYVEISVFGVSFNTTK